MRTLPPTLWVNCIIGVVILAALVLTRDPLALLGLFFLQALPHPSPDADEAEEQEPAIGFTAEID